ncbi:MAG: long-chain fatty acid--CoA ligase [Myxococcales bacterium]|nr:long-chain fatty acid--CoA ligase [Myxococcales bacterium]
MTTDVQGRSVDGQNLSELLMNRVAATPSLPAFMYKQGGAWQTLSWQQVGDRAMDVAHGLLALGVQLGDRVAIIGNTRPEWSFCDFGLVLAGGITVPIYPSSPAETCVYILNDSESAWVFVENDKQLGKLLANRQALPNVRRVILWDGEVPANASDWVMSYAQLIERGIAHKTSQVGALSVVQAQQNGNTTATIIYTSGTTGNPKGVVVAHDAYTVGCRYVRHALPVTEQDVHVLFLPLSHSFAKAIEIAGVTVGFCTAFAESIDKLADNCGEVRPTFVCAVPRVFEKAYARILNNAKEGGPLKWAIFQRALSVGLRCSRMVQHGDTPSGWLAMEYALANKLVFSKLRQRFGGRLKFFISGSAPLSKELAEFFHAAGLLILEGYGLTETNSMTSVNRLDRYKFGTVGQMLHSDLEIRLASDGEILTRGITNLRSYYKQPEATAEALDRDGWLHTGDIGEIDSEGFITITDRKKDLIKTSGGKYVAPQMIEGHLKLEPLISQAVVIGDQRKYVTALFSLNVDVARKLISDTGSTPPDDMAVLLAHSTVMARLDDQLRQVNSHLGSWEQVKYYRVLPRELTEADGELTPTLKVKRKVVSERYKDLIDSMYSERASAAD